MSKYTEILGQLKEDVAENIADDRVSTRINNLIEKAFNEYRDHVKDATILLIEEFGENVKKDVKDKLFGIVEEFKKIRNQRN